MNDIRGDIDYAIRSLINSLVNTSTDIERTQEERSLAFWLLAQWDKDRGTDWYTSTKKREENK